MIVPMFTEYTIEADNTCLCSAPTFKQAVDLYNAAKKLNVFNEIILKHFSRETNGYKNVMGYRKKV